MPGAVNEALVMAEVESPKPTLPGPLTLLQACVKKPQYKPSSVIVPTNLVVAAPVVNRNERASKRPTPPVAPTGPVLFRRTRTQAAPFGKGTVASSSCQAVLVVT